MTCTWDSVNDVSLHTYIHTYQVSDVEPFRGFEIIRKIRLFFFWVTSNEVSDCVCIGLCLKVDTNTKGPVHERRFVSSTG